MGQVFGWEETHRGDGRRIPRKLFQLFVDLVAFCASSAGALLAFIRLESSLDGPRLVLVCTGAALTLVLAAWIWIYADLRGD